MTERRVRRGVAVLAGVLLVLPSRLASAEITKGQCVDANASGQHLLIEHKLSAAREPFRQCADPVCPAMVRDDCTKRLGDLEKAQPTIVFDARDASDRRVSGVTVMVDGHALASALDGTALQVDPGEHEFTFTAPGQAPVKQTFVLNEGEKSRRERVAVSAAVSAPLSPAAPAASPPSPAPADTSPASPPSSGLGAQRTAGLVLGGAGVVGLGVGAALGLMASSSWNSAKSACGASTSQCNDSNVSSANAFRSTAETDAVVSTVGFIAGGVLVAAGAVLFLTGGQKRARDSSPAVSLVVAPRIAPGETGLMITGAFE